jgi:hypothetical protein
MRKDQMSGVTGNARGGDDEPFSQQTLAMNAFGIVFQNIALWNRTIQLNRCSFLMALSADKGNFERHHRRAQVFDGKDVMVAMTVLAAWRKGIAAGESFPVQRASILFQFAGVACAAVDLGQRRFVR